MRKNVIYTDNHKNTLDNMRYSVYIIYMVCGNTQINQLGGGVYVCKSFKSNASS